MLKNEVYTHNTDFKNEMTIPSNLIDNVIFTSAPISWSFSCSYDTSYDITADEMTVDASSRTGQFSGSGQFDVSMRKVYQKRTQNNILFKLKI